MSIKRTVSLTGINSSEIYSLSYPQSVLKFAEYDFSGFIRRCTDYCKRCAESGEYRLEDIVALRNSLGACHKYVEANIHGIYEKAVQFPSGGSITIIAVTTLSGGDITHAVPDNTGYITEGQLFLRRDSDIGKVIVDPFRSLSRLKQLVSGKKTRKDHPQVMNAGKRPV